MTLILSDEVENIGSANYIKATATIMDKDEKRLWVSAYAREAVTKKGMDDAQITGSASSYARKYALSGLFAIDDTKDPDGHDNRDYKPAVVKTVDTIAIAKDSLNKMLESYGHDNTVKKKLIINKVLQKSTVDTEFDANEVMQALEDGAV